MCVASVHLPQGNLRHVHLKHCLPHPSVPWNLVIQASSHESPKAQGDAPGCLLSLSLCCSGLEGPPGLFTTEKSLDFLLFATSGTTPLEGECVGTGEGLQCLRAAKTPDQSSGCLKQSFSSQLWNRINMRVAGRRVVHELFHFSLYFGLCIPWKIQSGSVQWQ